MMLATDQLVQGGVALAIFGSVMSLVIVPVVRAFIVSQKEALSLLRKAVEQNTLAIQAFQKFEREDGIVHSQLVQTQKDILERLNEMRCAETEHPKDD